MSHAALHYAASPGSGRALYILILWLWHQLHWWATPIYALLTAATVWGAWYDRDG